MRQTVTSKASKPLNPSSEKALRWWSGEFKRRSRPKPTVKMARVVRRGESGQAEMTIAVAGASIGVRKVSDCPELWRRDGP